MIFEATVAEYRVVGEPIAARNVLHQALGVGEVLLATTKWTGPVRPAGIKFTIEHEEL